MTPLSEANVSPAKEKQFEKKGILTVEDLVRVMPKRYSDYRNPVSLATIYEQTKCAIVGTLVEINKGNKYVKAKIKDKESNTFLNITWFNMPFMEKKLRNLYQSEVFVAGTVTYSEQYGRSMVNPEIFSEDIDNYKRIIPTYPQIAGMSSDYFMRTMDAALSIVEKDDVFPEYILKDFNIVNQAQMLKGIHRPDNENQVKHAKKRLIFEGLYEFAEKMELGAMGEKKESPIVVKNINKCKEFINNLPYEATEDQKKAVNNIVKNMKEGRRVNSLVQGDVGCGKTTVAFCIMITMAENGYQSVLMAPTGILAKQHYEELKEKTEKLGFTTVFLSNDLKTKEKKEIISKIKSGEADFIVGTHSVISKDVEYANLGLTIVDEEHKFGVIQREALKEKASEGVHQITMSATPIPRSLALTIYGNNIEVETINTLPNGRKKVQTCITNSEKATFDFMEKEIAKGHQCYIVCPLISESNSEKMEGVDSVEEVYQKACAYFIGKPINIGVINAKMKKDEIMEEKAKFERNEYQIIISTTIIEVGVNVPNATVIAIMNAERFGLAGLHQLRGRVGRGSDQAYCILKSSEKENERLLTMCKTTNGFEIAEADLKQRGTGDFIGTRQSGDNKHVMLMLSYPILYDKIKEYVKAQLSKGCEIFGKRNQN